MGIDDGNQLTTGGTATTSTTVLSRSRPTNRRRRALTGAVVVMSAVLLSACWSSNQDKDLGFINQARRQNGRAAVNGDADLMRRAQAWAEHLANIGRLEHSGGNGGVTSSTWATHQAFMGSSGHRANVLGNYDRVGTGVVRRGDIVWVVELYVRSC